MIKMPFSALAASSNTSLCLISFIATVSLWPLMIMPIIVGAYIDYLGFSEQAAGYISSANLAGIAIITLIVSLKTKHWPLQKIAGFGLAAMIVFDVASLFFHSISSFTCLRFLSGLAGGAAAAATAAAIARLEKPEKGYGIYIGFQFLLPAIAIYLLVLQLPSLGFNGMMMIIALEVLALCISPIFLNYTLKHDNLKPTLNQSSHEVDRLEASIILQGPALLSLLSLCIYGAGTAAIWAYSDRMGLAAGLSLEQTGNALSLITTLSIAGAIAVIFLGDRWGHNKPLTLGIVIQILGLFILLSQQSLLNYYLGIGLFILAWAFAWPYFLSIQAAIDNTGSVVVAGQFSNLVGNAIGPAMAAFLVTGGSYNGSIWLAISLCILSLGLINIIPSTQICRQNTAEI